MNNKAEIFLILKYGSVQNAYKAWRGMSYKETCDTFTASDLEAMAEYEYNMQVGGPSPFEPR